MELNNNTNESLKKFSQIIGMPSNEDDAERVSSLISKLKKMSMDKSCPNEADIAKRKIVELKEKYQISEI